MKILKPLTIALALTGLLTSCVCDPDINDAVETGQPLPRFSVEAYLAPDWAESVAVSNESLRGRPSVVCLFNTSCPDCREELRILQRVYNERADAANFICISRRQGYDEVKSYWTAHSMTLPVSPQSDDDVYHLFALSIIPRLYISDSEGIVRAIFTDAPIAYDEEIIRILDSLQ